MNVQTCNILLFNSRIALYQFWLLQWISLTSSFTTNLSWITITYIIVVYEWSVHYTRTSRCKGVLYRSHCQHELYPDVIHQSTSIVEHNSAVPQTKVCNTLAYIIDLDHKTRDPIRSDITFDPWMLLKLKGKIYKTIMPVVLDGSECWAYMLMRMLRWISVITRNLEQ